MTYPHYIQPRSVGDIWKELPQDKKIYFLAGGTDLFNYLRDGLIDAENSCFVDVSLLKAVELNGIVEETENIKISAFTTFSSISGSKLLKQYCPDLVAAAEVLGTPQIANRATIGGNIANASPAGDALPRWCHAADGARGRRRPRSRRQGRRRGLLGQHAGRDPGLLRRRLHRQRVAQRVVHQATATE